MRKRTIKCTPKNVFNMLEILDRNMPGIDPSGHEEFDKKTTLRHAINTVLDWMEAE